MVPNLEANHESYFMKQQQKECVCVWERKEDTTIT